MMSCSKRNTFVSETSLWSGREINGVRVYFAGNINSLDQLSSALSAQEIDKGTISNIFAAEKSCFALIMESQHFIITAVDRVRSIPVFVALQEGQILVSSEAGILLGLVQDRQVNWESVCQYMISGYVHGDRTLYSAIESPSAGTFVVIDKHEWNISRERYYRYLPKPVKSYDRNELVEEFGNCLDRAIDRTIEIANNRPIWVAISGGLDSRLVLAKLREKNYPNLNSFTYGIGGNHEILLARRTADKLNVPWQFIRAKVEGLRELYDSKERQKYSYYADGLIAVPTYVEYEVFSRIANENIIPQESLIVNGQSGDYLFGGHVPSRLYAVETLGEIIDYIIEKHCMHWPELLNEDYDSSLARSIEVSLKEILSDRDQLDRDTLLASYESWEWMERQPKATVNNQRLYEYFGYQWSLPLWDGDLMDFWSKVPYEEKFNQNLHQEYLRSYNYAGVFDRGRAPQRAFVSYYSTIIWAARLLGIVGGRDWKERFYEHMFYYSYFRPQLGLFGREFYNQNYRKTRRPRVVAFGARVRLHELGVLGINNENLHLINSRTH